MARRLNTQFLTILLLTVVGIGIAIGLAEKFLIHEHPDHYISLGDQAMKDHNWQDAVANYAKAAGLDRTDPKIQLRLAAALANTVQTDPDAIRRELGAYTQALEIDPKCLPALTALSDFFYRRAAQGFDASDFTSAIQYSRQVYQVDPTNVGMETRADEMVIQQWISGFNADQSDVDKAVKDMKNLWAKNPTDAQLPYAMARAEIEEGVAVARQNDTRYQLEEVTGHYNKAMAIFESVLTPQPTSKPSVEGVIAIPPQDKNAGMHFAYARVLMQLSTLDDATPDAGKKHTDRANAEIDQARKLAKQSDSDYVQINEFAADMAMRRGDIDGAIAIYKAMPDSLEKQLALAEVLSRTQKTQPDAVRTLKDAIGSLVDDPNHIQYYSARFLLTMELTKVQVFQYLEMAASPEKTALHDEIRGQLDRLDQVAGVRVSYPLEEIEARFEIFTGGEEEMTEVQNLNKLMTDHPPSRKDSSWYSLEVLLAQGFEDTNQASDAVAILSDVTQQYPKDVDSLKRLINLLITEHPDRVAPRVETLEQLDPNDPVLNVYKIELLLTDPVKNKDLIDSFYSKLKEQSTSQMSAKARIAIRIKNYDDAERLLRASVAKDPKNPPDWIRLAELLVIEKKNDQAAQAATQGLAENPNDTRLRILIPQIKGESQKAIEDLEVQLAKENPDKSQGEIVLAELAAKNGDFDGEGIHLKLAEKAAPSNPRIQDMLFNHYLKLKQYDQATACIPTLAKLDADHASGELYRLTLAQAQGDNQAAEAIARKLTQDKPEFARSWLALGEVLRSEQEYQQAIPQYRVCLDKQSTLVEGYVGLAQCYYGLNQPDDAIQVIQQGMSRLPNDQTLKQFKLTHELNYGKPEEAVAELKEEIEHGASPDLYAAMADVLLRYSQKLRDNNQPDDAVKQAKIGISVLEKPIDVLKTWPDDAELYVAKSECQLAAGEIQAALDTLVAWSNRPVWKSQPAPYMKISQFLERVGLHDKAEDEMHTALQESGYQVEYQIRMASLLSLHQKYDQALQLLRAVNKDNPDVREKIIQILIVAGKFDEAQKEVKSDLATNPPDAEQLLRTWALALYEHGKFQDAIDRATDALAMDEHDQTVQFCRARARLQLQPPDAMGAIQDLENVRQAAPKNPQVRICLADAHLILNQPDDAAGELQAGLRLLPSDKALRMKLVDIYMNGPHPRLSEALKALTEVDTVDPFDKDAEIFENEAVIYSKMKQNDNALAKSEVALKLGPGDPTIVRTNFQILSDSGNFQGVVDHYAALNPKLKGASWALWDLSLAEKQLGNDQALPDIKRALAAAKTEDDPVELDNIAQSINQTFSYDDAVNALIPLASDCVSAKISLARIYQNHGNDSAALSTVDELIANADKLNRRDQINLYTQSALMYQLAKPAPLAQKAYDAYQNWLKLEPGNMEALNNIACLIADDFPPDRDQEGLKYANQAVSEMGQLGRTEPRLLDTQAWLQILTGSSEDGIHTLNTVMEGFEVFPDEYYHLGEGYLRLSTPDAVQAESQAKLGLQMVNKRNAGDTDAAVRAKLQDLFNRSEAMKKAKLQQALAPAP